MAKKNENWYSRISKIFRAPSTMKRRIRDYREAPKTSTAMELFSKSQSFVYSNAVNSYGQYDRLSVSGDTRIAIPGPEKFKTLNQLIEQYGESGEKFLVYAYDHERKCIVPAWAHHPRITGTKDTVKITFDDGSTLVCTPDHECMLRDGTYRDAQDLQPGDSMMPFYRKQFGGVSKTDGKSFKGYYSIYTMTSNEDGGWRGWQPEHIMIAEWSAHRRVTKFDEHVHHIDFNPENNNPENLRIMNAHEHLALHAADTAKQWQDPNIRIKMEAGLQRAWDNDDGTRRNALIEFNKRDDIREHRRRHWELNNPAKSEDVKRKIGRSTHEYYAVKKQLFFARDIVDVEHELINECANDYRILAKRCKVNPCVMSNWLRKLNIVHTQLEQTKTTEHTQQSECSTNHKVVSVEFHETLPCGDLTVDGYECFATDTIVVHNSRYADMSEMEYCLHGDTKIAIPNGYKTIAELASECEHDHNHKFIVYSYDHNEGRIVPAWGKQARRTRFDHAYTVTFDNGQTIIGTADHRLMLRDGTYKKIAELVEGDAMMPFYRRDFKNGIKKDEGDGYRWIYTMDKKTKSSGWVSEHRVIGEWMKGSPLTNDEVVHHKNFKKYDNRPDNLQVMTDAEHKYLHSVSHGQWMKNNNPAERKDITFGRILELAERTGFNSKKICDALDTDTNVIKRRLRTAGYKNFETFARAYNTKWKNAGWNNNGSNNPRWKHDVTFDVICSKYTKGMTKEELSNALNVSHTVITNRLRDKGYSSYHDFTTSYQNMKVVSVEYYGEISLYDLTVDGYKNFATDSVISHNTPEISAALDIYADESVSQDEKGKSLHIFSDNRKVKKLLDELFYDTLNVDFNLRMWVRNIVKYGDFFLFNDVAPEYGIVQAFPIPVNEVEREEGFDPEDPQAVRFRWITQGNVALENWQVSHFRMLGNDAFLPYGSSLIEPARRVWRQLILIEDAMMVYRVVRSPERRIFYIDVGNIPPEEIDNYMQQQQARLRSNTIIDKSSGRVDLRYNALSVDEDYFIARRGGDSGTEITTLAGGQHVSATEDVEYIQKKLFAALKVPRAYLGYDEMLCLTGDTLIPLTDGRVVSLEDMVKMHARGDELEVYSYDLVNNKISAGRVTAAWKTKEVDELYEVRLDDGNIVKCTANHPFLGRDGQYCRADQLQVGQSLMPLYRRLSSKKKGEYLEGYEQTYDVRRNRWRYTHRLFGEQKCNINESAGKERFDVIHHVDFNRLNNSTTNLMKMGVDSHIRLHASHANKTLQRPDVIEKRNKTLREGWLISDEHRQLASQQMRYETLTPGRPLYEWIHGDQISDKMSEVMKQRWQDESYRQLKSTQNKELWNNIDYRARFEGDNHWSRKKNKEYDINWLRIFCRENNITSVKQWRKDYRDSVAQVSPVGIRYVQGLIKREGFKNWSEFKTTIANNHKVIAINRVPCHKVSVYDLTVEGFHNFALVNPSDNNSGIFVHNSSKATLAQEDIRFSRTVQTIQKVVISELQKLAYIHLFMNGYEGNDMFDFELRLTNPSTIAQQQKLELFNRKFEVFNTAMGIGEGKVFSQQYLLRTLMDMSEQQQKQLSDEVVEDVQRMAALGKVAEGGVPESLGFTDGFFNVPKFAASGEKGEAGGGDTDAAGGGLGDLGGEAETDTDDTGGGEDTLTLGRRRGGAVLGEEDDESRPRVTLRDTTDDVDDDDDVAASSDTPIRPSDAARRQYNSGRRRRSGRGALHMPDFARMTGMNDPQDNPLGDAFAKPFHAALDKPFKNPFGEARRHTRGEVITSTLRGYLSDPKPDYEARPRITSEMQSIFDKLGESFGAVNQLHDNDGVMSGLLSEAASHDADDGLNEDTVKFFNDIIGDDD